MLEDFIRAYKDLFSKFVSPTVQWIYENDIEETDEEEEEEPEYDEHVWLSLRNAEICCDAIEKAIEEAVEEGTAE